jgi:hypothetical protein
VSILRFRDGSIGFNGTCRWCFLLHLAAAFGQGRKKCREIDLAAAGLGRGGQLRTILSAGHMRCGRGNADLSNGSFHISAFRDSASISLHYPLSSLPVVYRFAPMLGKIHAI